LEGRDPLITFSTHRHQSNEGCFGQPLGKSQLR
jgi:hypothetical protein